MSTTGIKLFYFFVTHCTRESYTYKSRAGPIFPAAYSSIRVKPAAIKTAAFKISLIAKPCRRHMPQQHISAAAKARHASNGVMLSSFMKTPAHITGRQTKRLFAAATAWKRQSERVESKTWVPSLAGNSRAANPHAYRIRAQRGISASARIHACAPYPPEPAIHRHNTKGTTRVAARTAFSQNGRHTVSPQ